MVRLPVILRVARRGLDITFQMTAELGRRYRPFLDQVKQENTWPGPPRDMYRSTYWQLIQSGRMPPEPPQTFQAWSFDPLTLTVTLPRTYLDRLTELAAGHGITVETAQDSREVDEP